MQLKTKKRLLRSLEGAGALVAAAGLVSVSAMAGTDTTFDATVTDLTDWANGSLGKLAGIAGLSAALIGMVLKFDWKLIGGAAGIGLTAATGPTIVTSLASATM